MANFLDIYGRLFRWTALLVAAVTSSYSLSFLYLLSLAEMTVTRRTDRLKFCRGVTYLLMLFYLVVFAMALLHKFSRLCADDWSQWCEDLRDASQTLMYVSQANSETTGWYDIVHGSPVDVQGFFVLLIGGNILSSDYNTRQRVQALSKHEVNVACKTNQVVSEDAVWLTRAIARMFFLSGIDVNKAFKSSKAEEMSSGALVSLSRGVMHNNVFHSHLSKALRAAEGFTDLRGLIGLSLGGVEPADVTQEDETKWLQEVSNTIAKEYEYPGTLQTIEILPSVDASSPHGVPTRNPTTM